MAQIIIPQTNPVKYVPFQLDASVENIRLHDRYNFQYIPASFEGQSRYAQKWLKGDPIRQQIWSQNVAVVFIQLIKCDGTIIATLQPSAASLQGYLVNGIGWNILQFDYDSTGIAFEDEFYFVLNYGPDMDNLEKEISEPQKVWQTADCESVLFKYSHTYNDFNTIFKTSYNSYFNQTFYFRVEGRAHQHKPEGVFAEYDDQKLNRTLLSAKPFDSWQFTVGGKNGVPEWAGTVLNMIRSCNTIYADAYQISFFDKWEGTQPKRYRMGLYTIRFAKAQTEYGRVIEVCEPVTTPALALPDGFVGQQYIFTQQLTGTKPFTIDTGSLTKPSWMNVSIIDDILYIQSSAVLPPEAEATNIAISIKIDNPCGDVTLSDTIDVHPANVCVPVTFANNNILPALTLGQAWQGFIGLNGTAPFTINNVTKPSWMTITITDTGLELSGTPNTAGQFLLSITIRNCAGPEQVITFSETFSVSSDINITGYEGPFNDGRTYQSGLILAAPGTLVTLTVYADGGGPKPPNTYNLQITITGATLSGPLNVTNGGPGVATFVMPASGFVGWSGSYTGSNSLGAGTLTLS